jgi:hypothetical protein
MMSVSNDETSGNPSKIREAVTNIRRIAKDTQDKKIKPQEHVSLLMSLRENTVGLNILEDVDELDDRQIAVLYITKTLLNDFWRNLCGDASFGIEKITDEAAAFSEQLGHFLNLALATSGKNEETAISLFKAIALYYSCLSRMREKSRQIHNNMRR